MKKDMSILSSKDFSLIKLDFNNKPDFESSVSFKHQLNYIFRSTLHVEGSTLIEINAPNSTNPTDNKQYSMLRCQTNNQRP